MLSGIIENLPIGEYHADPALSKSGIKLLLEKSPAHYFHQYRTPAVMKRPAPKKGSDKFIGQALHDFVLEPRLFKDLYYHAPAINKNKTVFKALRKEMDAIGKIMIDQDEFDLVTEMAAALHAHPEAKGFFPSTNPEVKTETSYFWIDAATGLRCKCRTDMHIPSLRKAGDLKSCRSATETDFERDIRNYGYDIQDASYTSGLNTMDGGEIVDFTFICIEKEPPYCIALYTLPPSLKRRGYAQYRHGVQMAAACEKTGIWPGYPEGVRQITPSAQVMREYGYETQQEEEGHEPEEYTSGR